MVMYHQGQECWVEQSRPSAVCCHCGQKWDVLGWMVIVISTEEEGIHVLARGGMRFYTSLIIK